MRLNVFVFKDLIVILYQNALFSKLFSSKGPLLFATLLPRPFLKGVCLLFCLEARNKCKRGQREPLKTEQKQGNQFFLGINRLLVKTSYLR
jgi:hypothetical protein